MRFHYHAMRCPLISFLVTALVFGSPAWAADIDLSTGDDELLIEDDAGVLGGSDDGELAIEDEGDEFDLSITEDGVLGAEGTDTGASSPGTASSKAFSIKVDDIWAEAGHFYESDSPADNSGYFHTLISAQWAPVGNWEAKLSGRLDSYHETGDGDYDRTELDYGESYIRYRGEGFRATVGAQKVMWGRIDEVSPTDTLSVRDFSRGVLDYLPDRRRDAPVVRFEGFQGKYKLDAVWLPLFRKAKLPGRDSVWYPINRKKGEIIGLESTPAMSAAIKNANIDTNAPDTQGGGGFRFSGTEGVVDYALTAQRVRQSTPYFRYDPGRGELEAKYPLSWVYGGDLGVEAMGATWRFEAAWFSDTPVTRSNGGYTTTESINWATGVEFYPGDSDARVVLQLIGTNLVDAPDVINRESVYTFNGETSVPFLHQRWRFRSRFFIGVDKRDVYINPEIAFIAWEPHEIYLAGHFFEGDDGTVGDFYEDDSLLTLGWRAEF